MYKIDRRGGGSKNRSLGNYQAFSRTVRYMLYHIKAVSQIIIRFLDKNE